MPPWGAGHLRAPTALPPPPCFPAEQAALLLGFAARLGVVGLYSGMALGPALQCACYGWLIARIDGRGEARRAGERALEQVNERLNRQVTLHEMTPSALLPPPKFRNASRSGRVGCGRMQRKRCGPRTAGSL